MLNINCFLGFAEDLEYFDEEEMLKRAIALSLEEEKEEELCSIKGELLKLTNFSKTRLSAPVRQ